jgi:tryptophan synthase alpha chain
MGSGSRTTLSDDPLKDRWARLKAARRAAVIPYITAGFPDLVATRAFLAGAEAAGADVVELGVPWSDPVADGPVIQASTHAALQGGTTLAAALDVLAAARPALPVIVFSYLNPILAMGVETFAARARAAGAAGVLVTDLPVGTDPRVEAAIGATGLPLVRLVAPTTTGERLRLVAAASRGFVYLVSRLGVTGTEAGPGAELAARVAAVRAVTSLPVAVGFGISDGAQAALAARFADGVVVGSAIVERMRRTGAAGGLALVAELRAAVDAARAEAA